MSGQAAPVAPPPAPIVVDWLIRDATIVTMDAERRILTHASIAVCGDRISHVGKATEIEPLVMPRAVVDGRRFVVTPGFVNGHIHVTGEPITRGYVPDDSGWEENVLWWLIPLYGAQTAEEETVAARLAALEMLRTGTTTFLEAGTIRHIAPVHEALATTGIRGRIGAWCDDLAFDPSEDQTRKTDAAIRDLEATLTAFPDRNGLIGVWPLLIGHNMITGPLWQAAVEMARRIGGRVSAHMSPVEGDPAWFLEQFGKRPLAYLADIGALGPEVCLTHAVHLDDHEVALAAQSGMTITHCPMSALKGAYGAGPDGCFPELHAAGVNLMLGTDGNNNSNTSDLMRAIYLVSALFKDARRDTGVFPAHQALTMATLGGARGMGMERTIGSIEPGKKADFVLHDTDRPEWRPVLNVVNQLVWSADGRGVHSVWVDGRRVVDDYRCLTIDEERLYAEVDAAAAAVTQRSGLPDKQVWPVL